MSWGPPAGTHKKVSSNTGRNAGTAKKDGYARGPVPKSMIGTKAGSVDGEKYSGPDAATPPRP